MTSRYPLVVAVLCSVGLLAWTGFSLLATWAATDMSPDDGPGLLLLLTWGCWVWGAATTAAAWVAHAKSIRQPTQTGA